MPPNALVNQRLHGVINLSYLVFAGVNKPFQYSHDSQRMRVRQHKPPQRFEIPDFYIFRGTLAARYTGNPQQRGNAGGCRLVCIAFKGHHFNFLISQGRQSLREIDDKDANKGGDIAVIM